MKKLISILLVTNLVLIFSSCGKKETDNYVTSNPTLEENQIYLESTTESTLEHTESVIVTAPTTKKDETVNTNKNSETNSVNQSEINPNKASTTQKLQQTTKPETTKKAIEKTGDMVFTDKPSNRYISSIVKKYKVPAKNLACLYTKPLNDSNIVMEFNGSKDEEGKLIRNKDTLIAIYTIDNNLNSKRASNDKNLNEYSYGEMKVMFISTTKYIMPEFQKELNG